MKAVQRMSGPLALLGLAFLAGCGGSRTVTVTRFPGWNYRESERIAVVPTKTGDRRAVRQADIVTEQLTSLLTQNGQFVVLSKIDLKDAMSEQDFSRLADIDPETALPEGRIKVAQALVIPTITTFELIKEREAKRLPVYARDPRTGAVLIDGRTGRPLVTGEEVFQVYRHGAVIGGSVRVIDAATNETLYSYTLPEPIRLEATENGRPPRQSAEDLAADAARELALDFYMNVAPIETRIKVKKDSLVIATDYFDGRYEQRDKLSSELKDFLLVVRDLPPACDRNEFRVAIAAKDGRENLYEQTFTWSGHLGKVGQSWKVPVELLLGAKDGAFVAKLYSGRDPEPILTRSFKLQMPKEDKKSERKSKKQQVRDQQTDEPPPQPAPQPAPETIVE